MRRRYRILLSIAAIVTCSAAAGDIAFPHSRVECADCSNATPPHYTSNGKPEVWSGTTANVYVDSNFSASERTDVQNAINTWNANGNVPQFTLLSASTADPGQGAAGTIRIVNGTNQNFLAYTNSSADPVAATITSSTVTFDRNFKISDGNGNMINAYTPVLNNGDTFFQKIIEHELGHTQGFDDYKDANGNEIDSPGPSVDGAYKGNNNSGGGNLTDPTDCDRQALQADRSTNATSPGTGGPTGPTAGDGSGSSGGGGTVSYCYTWDDWNDETNTLTDYTECW